LSGKDKKMIDRLSILRRWTTTVESGSPRSADRRVLCAEHVRQLGGASPLHNVMDVKW